MGTNGGLYIFNENGIVNVKETNFEIPENFILFQNYPNPFN